jgi:hypothetical protein
MAEYYLKHYGYVSSEPYLAHHGIKGQQWGVKHGPPYPLDANTNRDIRMSRNNTDVAKKYKDYRDTSRNSQKIRDEQKIKEDFNNLARLKHKETIMQSLEAVNPDIHGEGRNFNCQNSATAYEMRRKGYDVTARRRDDGSNNISDIQSWFKGAKWTTINQDKNSKDPFYKNLNKYNKMDSQSSEYRAYKREWRKRQEAAWKDFCTEISAQPIGSRGIWCAGWMMTFPEKNHRKDPRQTSMFHAMNYEIYPSGPVFYDSQSKYHKVIHDNKWYVYGVADPREYSYIRTDNLEPDPSIVEAVISRKG